MTYNIFLDCIKILVMYWLHFALRFYQALDLVIQIVVYGSAWAQRVSPRLLQADAVEKEFDPWS